MADSSVFKSRRCQLWMEMREIQNSFKDAIFSVLPFKKQNYL